LKGGAWGKRRFSARKQKKGSSGATENAKDGISGGIGGGGKPKGTEKKRKKPLKAWAIQTGPVALPNL